MLSVFIRSGFEMRAFIRLSIVSFMLLTIKTSKYKAPQVDGDTDSKIKKRGFNRSAGLVSSLIPNYYIQLEL